MLNPLANKRVINVLTELGQITLLAREAVASLLKWRVAWRDLLYQIYFIGVKSQSVVLITGAFTGMVLGAQTYFQFHKVKMDTATLAVVGVSMCSELGPVLTALMVAGRVGAAIAAELGTMRVTEQIDALRTLATHPVDYLVVPRLIAAHIALPLLTVESIVVGIVAGYLVGVYLLGIDPTYLVVQHAAIHARRGRGDRPDQGVHLWRHHRAHRLLQGPDVRPGRGRRRAARRRRRWCIPPSPS